MPALWRTAAPDWKASTAVKINSRQNHQIALISNPSSPAFNPCKDSVRHVCYPCYQFAHISKQKVREGNKVMTAIVMKSSSRS